MSISTDLGTARRKVENLNTERADRTLDTLAGAVLRIFSRPRDRCRRSVFVSALGGQAAFHSLSVLMTIGASGTGRLLEADFGLPITFQRSARCHRSRCRRRDRHRSRSNPAARRRATR